MLIICISKLVHMPIVTSLNMRLSNYQPFSQASSIFIHFAFSRKARLQYLCTVRPRAYERVGTRVHVGHNSALSCSSPQNLL